MSSKTTPRKTVNLALQGGGSHGAFTWGVLDAMLEDGRIDIEAICATSAGTMNACAYLNGVQKAIADGKTSHAEKAESARQSLHNFWSVMHQSGLKYNPLRQSPLEKWLGLSIDHSITPYLFHAWTQLFSPYQTNPFDINPLKEVLEKTIDFNAIKECECTKLYVSATHVQSGKLHIFKTDELSIDVALASACLPFIYKAVKVDGEDYWDGGFIGNPALYPLFYNTQSRDILLMHINPIARPKTPKNAIDIMDRMNEISFNSSLLTEMRAIAFVKELLDEDMLKEKHKKRFKNVLMHSVLADDALREYSSASKFDTDWDFLITLRDKGRETMKDWLARNFDNIGVRDSVNIHETFLD